MSWSSALRRIAVAALVLGLAPALAACSFSPVYSGASTSQPMLDVAFAKPTTRVEQIIYQELALRFGTSTSPTAPLVMVSTLTPIVTVGRSYTTNPNKLARQTVTATLTVTRRDGSDGPPISLTREASAEYTTSDQVQANTAAATDAAERAAKAVSESLRLALLASLSR